MGFRRRSSRAATMREINAKYDGICAETGQRVKAGDRCLYDPLNREVYGSSSVTWENWRAAQFARSWAMADANW